MQDKPHPGHPDDPPNDAPGHEPKPDVFTPPGGDPPPPPPPPTPREPGE